MQGFVHRTVKTDKDGNVRDSVVVHAQSWEGKEGEDQRLKGVEVNLTYMAQGQPGKATITADDGVYTATLQKAVFRGHVHVTTEDGMELHSEELIHRGDHNTVRSESLTDFKRKDLSGTALGFTYEAETGQLQLLKDVNLKVQDEDNVPTFIKSDRAEASKQDGLMRFIGNVEITQGTDRLKADRLLVNFSATDRVIYRAQAIDGVEVWTSGSTQVPRANRLRRGATMCWSDGQPTKTGFSMSVVETSVLVLSTAAPDTDTHSASLRGRIEV